MKVGDRVRVATSVLIYHHPEHRNHPFDIQGQEGEIIANATLWQDQPIISANFPWVVKLGPKLKVHLTEAELEQS
jgi:hypothetical protein